MNSLFQELGRTCGGGIDTYSREYMKRLKQTFEVCGNPHILKSQLRTLDYESADAMLRFSLVFNDLTLWAPPKGNTLSIMCLTPDWFRENTGSAASVILSKRKVDELGLDTNNPALWPSVVFAKDERIDRFLSEVGVLIESGRLLVQPDRVLLAASKELTPDGRRRWDALDVAGQSPLSSWQLAEEKVASPLSIEYSTSDSYNHEQLFEVTMPYLQGVSYSDLVKILDDEHDLVSGLKRSIKTTIDTGKGAAEYQIMAKDLIAPNVDRVNRKFRSIVNTHSFRVAGAGVATLAVAYTSVLSAMIPTALATIFGTGGLGVLGTSFSAYKEKMNELKEDPYYFLWRCQKAQR